MQQSLQNPSKEAFTPLMYHCIWRWSFGVTWVSGARRQQLYSMWHCAAEPFLGWCVKPCMCLLVWMEIQHFSMIRKPSKYPVQLCSSATSLKQITWSSLLFVASPRYTWLLPSTKVIAPPLCFIHCERLAWGFVLPCLILFHTLHYSAIVFDLQGEHASHLKDKLEDWSCTMQSDVAWKPGPL